MIKAAGSRFRSVFMKRLYLLPAAAAAFAAAALLSCAAPEAPPRLADATVVFVGGDTTAAWPFDLYFPGYRFYKVIYDGPDKTRAWDEVARYQPDVVVVKECASYFDRGGDTPIDDYHGFMEEMVDLCRDIGAEPVLATTLPVDVGWGGCTQLQLDDIMAFNYWVREYSVERRLVYLDFNAAICDGMGELPAGAHDGDGLHINSGGYDIIAPLVLPNLDAAVR